jgi:uncharacterized protein YegJ (DUF2314 family)
MRTWTWLAMLPVLAALIACSDRNNELVETKREGEPTVYSVEAEDIEMNAAMAQARETISQFRERLTSPPATQTYLTLKVRLGSDDAVEHIWIETVELVGEKFKGVIANEPIHASTPALGQSITVSLDRVSDWMAIDSGKLVGGYTLRVLRDRMAPDQRAEFDASMGFTID